MSTPLTLYQIEEYLAALLDTREMADTPEREAEIQREIERWVATAVEKRDAIVRFLAHCEGQISNIEREIERLTNLKKSYQRAIERMENYVVRAIVNLGPDDRGRWRKLEGKTCVLTVRHCPPSVEITDESAIPPAFKTITVTVPAEAWERFVDAVDVDERTRFLDSVIRADVAVDKRAVKRALEDGESVPGAELRRDKLTLVVK